MEIDEIKGLEAKERLRKLKDIEKQKKKEIEEAEKLIKESEREINEEEEFRRKVPIDEVKAETIDQLEGIASQEAKEIWKTTRGRGTIETTGTAGEKTLEATVEKTRGKEETKMPEYGKAIEQAREEQQPAYRRQETEAAEAPTEKYSSLARPGELPEEHHYQRRKKKEE